MFSILLSLLSLPETTCCSLFETRRVNMGQVSLFPPRSPSPLLSLYLSLTSAISFPFLLFSVTVSALPRALFVPRLCSVIEAEGARFTLHIFYGWSPVVPHRIPLVVGGEQKKKKKKKHEGCENERMRCDETSRLPALNISLRLSHTLARCCGRRSLQMTGITHSGEEVDDGKAEGALAVYH